jgi:hypothetical protein
MDEMDQGAPQRTQGSSAELGIELRSSKVPTDSKIKKARYQLGSRLSL